MMPPNIKASCAAVKRADKPESPLFSYVHGDESRRSAPGGIFLTGGTGFLGCELVARFLARGGDEPIYILIRARSRAEARKRFHSLYNSPGLPWPDSYRKRIRPLWGDISLPWMGLDPDEIRNLAGRVTRIVHSAASINLNASLQEARRTNLAGAREILRLALSCRRLESLAWISTAFVAGNRIGCILEGELQCGQKFRNGYEQSKFEAEILVRSYKSILPVTVFRPSIIVGDSRTGYTRNFSSIYWPLRLVAEGELRRVPGDPRTPLDLVPVNYVADAVAELLDRHRSTGFCYQLVAGRGGTITAREFLDRAIRYFDRSREPLRFIPPRAHADSRLRVFFEYLTDYKQFDDSATRTALRGTGLRCPRITDYLDRLFGFCQRTAWGGQGGIDQYRFHSWPELPVKGVSYDESACSN